MQRNNKRDCHYIYSQIPLYNALSHFLTSLIETHILALTFVLFVNK